LYPSGHLRFSLRVPAFTFTHGSGRHTIATGGLFTAPRPDGFRDTPKADLESLVAEIAGGRPWREVVQARYATANPWLHRIITDASRTAFVGPVLPAGNGPVLDVGSGWGQLARSLARHRAVVALEPVAERLAFIQAAAKQDGVHAQLACLGADYLETAFEDRFQAICAIGVLEWVGAFQKGTDPQARQREFLAKARRELAEGGCLVIGIENRLGLKYLCGCADDHLGVPHLASLPAPLARERWQQRTGGPLASFTYSRTELAAMLHDAGFTRIEFFGAFPDYKLPAAIIGLDDEGQGLSEWLSSTPTLPPEHNGYDGGNLDGTWQAQLAGHYRALGAAARDFVPSFFVRAA
jgi:hypothetical protein